MYFSTVSEFDFKNAEYNIYLCKGNLNKRTEKINIKMFLGIINLLVKMILVLIRPSGVLGTKCCEDGM